MIAYRAAFKKISPEQWFMASVVLVNAGNYVYNLFLGRILGPAAYAEAALLVTLLLVLSFLGMTFQLATAKFAVLFKEKQWKVFEHIMYRKATYFGLALGALVVLFSKSLQALFHTQSYWVFVVFGMGIPFYFFMSVNRGYYQGKLKFSKLSITYQTEMWSRLVITITLLYFIPLHPGILVAIGIFISFVFGLFPSNTKSFSLKQSGSLLPENTKKVSQFILLTAGYELTQIIINNSDVLLVKHYFSAVDAGLYASLALIGRVVYFVAWMFVMLLLPTVVKKQQEGKPTAPILFTYVFYICLLSLAIVLGCYFFPEIIIKLMFGEAYVSIAGLLWLYALATSLFAVSNIFAYYFLSLDHYVPVIVSGVLGMSQVFLVVFFHKSLHMVVYMQIVAMALLLILQVLYFFNKKNSLSKGKSKI